MHIHNNITSHIPTKTHPKSNQRPQWKLLPGLKFLKDL